MVAMILTSESLHKATTVTRDAAVLEKKSISSQPIKCHDGHVDIQIVPESNNTSTGTLEEFVPNMVIGDATVLEN